MTTAGPSHYPDSVCLGDASPWGTVQALDVIDAQRLPGLVFCDTPSHGGFFVPARFLDQIPAAAVAATSNQQGRRGWFEEDCDAALVAAFVPGVAADTDRRRAALAAVLNMISAGLYPAPLAADCHRAIAQLDADDATTILSRNVGK